MAKYTVGQKIYYTGDMANRPGWFEITEVYYLGAYNPEAYDLKEIDGNRKFKSVIGISDKYEGHCGMRFVTKEAYDKYKERQLAQFKASLKKYNAVNV